MVRRASGGGWAREAGGGGGVTNEHILRPAGAAFREKKMHWTVTAPVTGSRASYGGRRRVRN